MLKAIIENDGNTLVMGLPCKWSFMREQLASIGINAAHKVRCMDEEENPIKVKVFGDSEFENKLASFISPDDTISVVNAVMEIYQNLPYQNQLDAKEAVMSGNVSKEGCEIITDNTQLTVFGGFAPNSESAQVLSKALGSRTVQSGSVNRGKHDPS